jgi:hypothetical protein
MFSTKAWVLAGVALGFIVLVVLLEALVTKGWIFLGFVGLAAVFVVVAGLAAFFQFLLDETYVLDWLDKFSRTKEDEDV